VSPPGIAALWLRMIHEVRTRGLFVPVADRGLAT
jgi:hypothetical protein